MTSTSFQNFAQHCDHKHSGYVRPRLPVVFRLLVVSCTLPSLGGSSSKPRADPGTGCSGPQPSRPASPYTAPPWPCRLLSEATSHPANSPHPDSRPFHSSFLPASRLWLQPHLGPRAGVSWHRAPTAPQTSWLKITHIHDHRVLDVRPPKGPHWAKITASAGPVLLEALGSSHPPCHVQLPEVPAFPCSWSPSASAKCIITTPVSSSNPPFSESDPPYRTLEITLGPPG